MIEPYDYDKLKELVKNRDVPALKQFMKDNDLIVDHGAIISKHQEEYSKGVDFYDIQQHIRKIFLNSSYGATLADTSGLYDRRVGASITLSGRNITRHMSSKAVQELTGEYTCKDWHRTLNDTDSVYVTFENTKYSDLPMADKVKLADEICEHINDSFSEFCQRTFNVDETHGNLIRCAREVVYKSGLLLAKKHYALLVTDNEGNDVTHNDLGGHIKLRGLDLVRADTSPEIKKLLTRVLELILTNGTKSDVEDVIIDFLKKYNDKDTWEKGAPKSVRNISDWEEKLGIIKGDYTVGNKSVHDLDALETLINVPATARAAINWNKLRIIYNDLAVPQIMDGHRVIVVKLKPNPFGFKSVAIPYDLTEIPQWFKELCFDVNEMDASVVIKKIRNMTDALHWELNLDKNKMSEQFGDTIEEEW